MKMHVTAIWLGRLARHLALMALLAVLFKASGWADPGQAGILMLALSSPVVHQGARMAATAAGRTMRHDP